MKTYTVVIDTPKGTFDVDVPTFLGPGAAGRRAIFTLAAARYGDLLDLHIVSITEKTS